MGKALASLGIEARLVLITALVLFGFLALTGWLLDRAFRASTLAGVEEQLRLVIYSLLGAAEADAVGVRVDDLPEPRLSQPASGLYAVILDREGNPLWRSPSALATNVAAGSVDAVLGEFRFSRTVAGPTPRFALSYLVIWDDAAESELVFEVAADQAPTLAVINDFRSILFWGLGASTLLVTLAQILAIRWGLAPLRSMAKEVEELEEGRREHLSLGYPKELLGLQKNLERFIVHERRRRTRYRNALEDLAHSLKTPLAVIRNALAATGLGTQTRRLVSDQLDQMDGTVTHQLAKATGVGPVVVGKPIAVAGLIERLLRALQTAYADRALAVEMELPEGLAVRGDEGDLMEIFGNLLENAFKYTHSRVRISGQLGTRNLLRFEDDGPGVPAGIRQEVLGRGARGDQVTPGQGIGLSVVSELLALYGGSLAIGDSALGGASVEISLPR